MGIFIFLRTGLLFLKNGKKRALKTKFCAKQTEKQFFNLLKKDEKNKPKASQFLESAFRLSKKFYLKL